MATSTASDVGSVNLVRGNYVMAITTAVIDTRALSTPTALHRY